MAFYFFTEPSKLNVQTQNQAFGAIDEDNYRLNNLFTATSNAKAYAVTSGNVLVQPIAGSTTLVNIVLKPINQPDLNLPKIEYIIYKGITKSSLINASKVADPTNNDLTRKIWESHANLLIEMPGAPPEPLASEALGFEYSATGTGSYQTLDADTLDLAFYDNNNTLFPIEAGDHIGDFNSSNLGCLFVFEKIGFQATFKLARELDSQLTFTALGSTPTQAEIFRRKHDKEDILAFMDSAAFFSAFNGINIKLTSDGTTFEEKLPEAFYTDVTAKHFNKNTIYVDIRNENLDSFNYYENYSNFLKLDLLGTDTYEEVDYYRDEWPLLAVKNSEFDDANSEKILGVSLYKGDNEFPQFFLKRGKLLNIDLEDKKNVSLRFLQHEIDEAEENYQLVEKLQIPQTDTDVIKSNYFQLRYIKRYTTPDSDYSGLALKNESFLDNMFPIFDMKLPFVNSGSVDVKMFTDACYVDKTNINELDFTVDIGIARDNQGTSFMALPATYNSDELQAKEKPPFYSEQTFGGDTFFDYFNKKLTNNKIRESIFEDGENEYEFLAFAETMLDEVVLDPSTATIEDDVTLESSTLALEYDFENFNIFSLTNDEYTQLETAKNTEFTAPYKVYLGIANTEPLTTDDDEKSITYYALRGLKENGAGEIGPHEYVSNIKVFAIDDVYNWDAAAEKKCIIEFDKVNSDFRDGVYGFDWYRSDYNSILENNTEANREALKQEYTPKVIAGEDYYVPWLSIKQNQTVTLELDKTFRKKSEFTTIEITPHPDFTIAPVDFKSDRKIQITCNNTSATTAQLIVMADGVEAGALNIWYPPEKTINMDWVYVEFGEGNPTQDQTVLPNKMDFSDLDDAITKGFRPPLIDVTVTPAVRILDVSAQTPAWVTQGKLKSHPTHGKYIERSEYAALLNGIVAGDGLQNNARLTVYCFNRKIIDSATINNDSFSLVGGASPVGTGVFYMVLDDKNNMSDGNIIHEALHSLGLRHSFSATSTHQFKQKKTDNYMDYFNTKRHTWKWQWELAQQYPDLV